MLDKVVVAAQKDLEDPTLDAKSRHALLTLIEDAKADEADDVRDALVQMRLIRGVYTGTLHAAQADLVRDGYDPAGIWADAHFGPGGPPLNGGGTGPRIDGPGTPPLLEGLNTRDQDDLDLSIPGTGIALGGDGAHGYPNILVPPDGDTPGINGPNPIPHPEGTRPLPTGTAVGPNGEHYGFYGLVPYKGPDGQPNTQFSVPDTVVVDLAHPDKVLFTLHGISQASGAFDPNTGKMVIMGNNQNGQRGLWESAPINQNGNWGNTLQPKGTFNGALNGNRESQIVALPQGKGFMIVGAAADKPIQGAVASTPQGLLNASPTPLVGQLPDIPYGPTFTDIRQVTAKTLSPCASAPTGSVSTIRRPIQQLSRSPREAERGSSRCQPSVECSPQPPQSSAWPQCRHVPSHTPTRYFPTRPATRASTCSTTESSCQTLNAIPLPPSIS